MAKHVLNPNQLRMFMTPREIAATIPQNETEVRGPADIAKDWQATGKLDAAKRSGLHKRIAESGVKKPVDVLHFSDGYQTVVNGHHRFISSLDQAPDKLIPVMHHGSYSSVDWTSRESDPTGDKPYSPNW